MNISPPPPPPIIYLSRPLENVFDVKVLILLFAELLGLTMS